MSRQYLALNQLKNSGYVICPSDEVMCQPKHFSLLVGNEKPSVLKILSQALIKSLNKKNYFNKKRGKHVCIKMHVKNFTKH